MKRVLFLTHEKLGPQMAGPAIRAWELATQVSRVAEVTLASPFPCQINASAFSVASYRDSAACLKAIAKSQDILVVQGLMLQRFPFLARLGKYLVVDLYDPFIFESYPFYQEQPDARLFSRHWQAQNQQMRVADYSICASERQRDLWIGRYCALGRLTPELYQRDPSFDALIGLVPFGLGDVPPESGLPAFRGVVPGIHSEDFVLLWGGGIWNWFDPLTVIRAIAKLDQAHIKLYFMGTGHPNPEQPEMRMLGEAIALAKELGVFDRLVFFNKGWVPYQERHLYLLEASVGVSSHFEAVETRFSFRTRVLDYLWSGLPILTTAGDSMAELVEKDNLGRVMPPRDVDAWAQAILELAEHPDRCEEMRRQVQAVAPRFSWENAAKPLVTYCQAPYHTPRAINPHKELLRGLCQEGGLKLAKKALAKLQRSF